jgi:hypothetical protein
MEGSLVAYKVFTNGSVLNASEINENLMNQSVMVFSNSTARAAALTAPVEGMLTWLQDTNKYENYNGSAWVALGGSGVLQVKSVAKLDTQVSASIASGATVDITGLSVSITPTSSSNKVLLIAQVNGVVTTNGLYVGFELVRDSTKIGAGTNEGNRVGMTSSNGISFAAADYGNMATPITFLDSPSTTSATTYKVRIVNQSSTTRTVYVNRNITDANTLSDTFRTICTLTAMEVTP